MEIPHLQGWAVAPALAIVAFACSGDDAAGRNDADDDGPGGGGQFTSADGTRYHGTFPVFPGAGTSDEAEPLDNGMICDSVPGEDLIIADPIRQCFFDKNDPNHTMPAATLEQVLECAQEGDLVHIRLTFHPWFVDNTYGETQIGWADGDEPAAAPMGMDMRMPKGKGKGHTFKDLVGSDHAEIIVEDGDGEVVLQFKLDYVSEDPTAPSGYASAGVTGGEGKVLVGDASAVVGWMTSIDRNLNERGYAQYTIDSPATDDRYTPNSDTPEWDYRVVYDVWIDADVFGAAGFGGALIEFVHASPAKADSNTIEVEPGDCPPPPCPGDDPDADCGGGGTGGGGDPCVDNDPDTFCGEGGVGGGSGEGGRSGSGGSGGSAGDGGDPQYCMDHPEDPGCNVD